MKTQILVALITAATFFCSSAQAKTTMTRTANTAISKTIGKITTLTPNPRKPGTDKSMRRMRSKVFTVNVLSFNKKIQEKHERRVKALAMAAKRQAGKGKKTKSSLVIVASIK